MVSKFQMKKLLMLELFLYINLMTSHEEKSNHRNDKIKKLIKELPLREKMKSVALLYYLD